jgi:hypothetical protein
MKPYGRDKSVKFPGKTDCHPRKGYVNWWETITRYISRNNMKQKLKKDLEDIDNGK